MAWPKGEIRAWSLHNSIHSHPHLALQVGGRQKHWAGGWGAGFARVCWGALAFGIHRKDGDSPLGAGLGDTE